VKRLTLLVIALLLAACAGKGARDEEVPDYGGLEDMPMRPVGHVDLDRFMGRWYIIANIPYFAERGNVGVYVTYSRREDGMIDDLYTAQDAFGLPPFTKNGLIEVTNPLNNAEGRITFLGPLWQDYAVLYLDDDYRYTVIGHPTRDYAWVFAREPRIPATVYKKMIDALVANQFDPARVLKVPQFPEQVGAPGFQ
jgi:apolipoprotein D and lipocalin family protein